MRTVFSDYEKMVIDEYLRKKEKKELSPSLTILTPADLRDECERICSERFEKRDEAVLRDFFGKASDQKACLQAIRGVKVTKFKPLITYLNNNGQSNTSPKNVQLLAWLIDFPERPYDYSRNYVVKTDVSLVGRPTKNIDEEGSTQATEIKEFVGSALDIGKGLPNSGKDVGVSREGDHPDFDKTPVASDEHELDDTNGSSQVFETAVNEKEVKSKVRSRKIVFVGLLVFVLGGGAYSIKEIMIPPPTPPSGSCMYWNKDHYEQVPCNQKMSDILVLALDTNKLKNFRMLTCKDSVLKRGKGLVWYSKIDNDVQFYTGDGRHPVVYSRRLKPATQYIIDKYADLIKPPVP